MFVMKTFSLLKATYNKDFRPRDRLSTDLGYTLGGYSKKMTVPEDFAIKIPESFPLEKAGPVWD